MQNNSNVSVAEFEELKARVAALETKLAPKEAPAVAARPIENEGPRITTVIEVSRIKMPGQLERKRIREIVCDLYPKLRPADLDDSRFAWEFDTAFDRIACLGRTDETNRKYPLSWWIDEAMEWARLRNRTGDLRGAAFLVAVIGAGDVKFMQSDNNGNVWELGLSPYSGGRPATEAWRKVLKGELLAPVPGRYGLRRA